MEIQQIGKKGVLQKKEGKKIELQTFEIVIAAFSPGGVLGGTVGLSCHKKGVRT